MAEGHGDYNDEGADYKRKVSEDGPDDVKEPQNEDGSPLNGKVAEKNSEIEKVQPTGKIPAPELKSGEKPTTSKNFSREDIFKELEKYITVNSKYIKEMAKMFEYQHVDFTSINRALRLRESDPAKLKTDIVHMVALYLSGGNNFVRMIQCSQPARKRLIQGLVDKYGIKSNAKNATNSTITLSRVASTFPVMTLSVLFCNYPTIKRPIRVDDHNIFGDDFPKTLTNINAASCIPDTAVGKELLKALATYLIAEYRVVGFKTHLRVQDAKSIYKEIEPKLRAGHKLQAVPPAKREAAVVKFGLIDAAGAITPKVKVAITWFNNNVGSTI